MRPPRTTLDGCTGQDGYSPEVVKEAAARGDRLLMIAGDLPTAMRALRRARQESVGEPLRGVLTPETQACISDDHYAYLEEMIEHGIPSRREYPRKRVRADPYPSALDHLGELYEKSWKDAKWGIVLYCTDATENQTRTSLSVAKDESRSSCPIDPSAARAARSMPCWLQTRPPTSTTIHRRSNPDTARSHARHCGGHIATPALAAPWLNLMLAVRSNGTTSARRTRQISGLPCLASP